MNPTIIGQRLAVSMHTNHPATSNPGVFFATDMFDAFVTGRGYDPTEVDTLRASYRAEYEKLNQAG